MEVGKENRSSCAIHEGVSQLEKNKPASSHAPKYSNNGYTILCWPESCLAILVNRNRLEIPGSYCMIPATVPTQICLNEKYKYLKPFHIYFSFKCIKNLDSNKGKLHLQEDGFCLGCNPKFILSFILCWISFLIYWSACPSPPNSSLLWIKWEYIRVQRSVRALN